LIVLFPGCARAPRRTLTPSVTPSSVPAAQTPGFYHSVRRGETMYRIAKTYDQDWHELMDLNNISDPSKLEVGQQLFIPRHISPATPPMPQGPLDMGSMRRIVGPKRYSYSWRTITLHHSATLKGGAQAFNRNHQERRMGGLFYHFVIGNGSATGDGALEVGWRWKRQVKANRPNDIQICLVGDFNRQNVSEAQFSTMVQLIRVLQEDYGIPIQNIRRHEDIKGKHTECPGRRFPFARVLGELRKQAA
jgi:LysM repeat protein